MTLVSNSYEKQNSRSVEGEEYGILHCARLLITQLYNSLKQYGNIKMSRVLHSHSLITQNV